MDLGDAFKRIFIESYHAEKEGTDPICKHIIFRLLILINFFLSFRS